MVTREARRCAAVVADGIGGVAAWFIAMRHPGGTGPTEADAVTLVLYFASAGSIVAFAELFRARARMLVRGQAALQASEARLELATKAAAVGVWEWRLLTNEMIYSPEAKAICGFPADEPVTYEMVAAVTHPAQRPSLKEMALSERTAVLRLLDLGSIRRSCGPGPGSRRDGRDVRPDKAPIHVRRRRRNVRFAPSFQHPLIPISKADGV